jgi:hypothetical protein
LTSDKVEKSDREGPLARPARDSFRLSQYVFYSDLEMKRDAPLFKELAELREQILKELQLPGNGNLVHVYLFSDKERYDRFIRTRYPDLPERRAFFIAQPHNVGSGEDLLVFTYWSDRLRQDLRHELTHAMLHSVLRDVPLWLDEGLAEYFELPPEWKGVNRAHVRALRQPDVSLGLTHLEQLTEVQQMHPAEYREAWAWVYLMLRSTPEVKGVLLGYLRQLRTNPTPGSLHPRLAAVLPTPEGALLAQLARLERAGVRGQGSGTRASDPIQ